MGQVEALHSLYGQIPGSIAAALDRKQCRLLTGCAASAFAADQRIVDLNQSFEPIAMVPIPHCVTQLAQHQLRRRPRNANHLRQPRSQYAALVGAHQVNRHKLLGQRHSAMFEYRADRDRSLMSVLRALVQVMTLQYMRLAVSATRTDNPFGQR